MRYGNPSIGTVLNEYPDLQALTVLPLYPQYSATTTASVFDAISRHYQQQERIPDIRFVSAYHQHPAWLDAMEARIRNHWDLHGRGQRLLFSFHGIPVRFAERGDPYPEQCRTSAEAMGLPVATDLAAGLTAEKKRRQTTEQRNLLGPLLAQNLKLSSLAR